MRPVVNEAIIPAYYSPLQKNAAIIFRLMFSQRKNCSHTGPRMKILTCNIRCFGANDGKDNWVNRCDLCGRVSATFNAGNT